MVRVVFAQELDLDLGHWGSWFSEDSCLVLKGSWDNWRGETRCSIGAENARFYGWTCIDLPVGAHEYRFRWSFYNPRFNKLETHWFGDLSGRVRGVEFVENQVIVVEPTSIGDECWETLPREMDRVAEGCFIDFAAMTRHLDHSGRVHQLPPNLIQEGLPAVKQHWFDHPDEPDFFDWPPPLCEHFMCMLHPS